MPEKEKPAKTKHRTPAREAQRLARKQEIAHQQAEQFENEISGQELNLVRLEIVPVAARDEEWYAQEAAAKSAIATLDQAIETTLAAAQ